MDSEAPLASSTGESASQLHKGGGGQENGALGDLDM